MADGRAKIKAFLRRAFAAIVLAVAIAYAGDAVIFRLRAAKYGTVKVTPFYAVPRKDHKTEYMFDDPRDETCVNSLFPREGDKPCWYLKTHKQREIDL